MSSIRTEIHRIAKHRRPLDVRVEFESVEQVSDSFLRVSVRGDELAAYDDPRPADAFKLLLPPPGLREFDDPKGGADGMPYWENENRRPLLRAFTVRCLDPDRLRLTFDIVVHEGHMLNWLRDAQPGDVIGLRGMRVEFVEGQGIDHHLLVGDAAALPAVASILESLGPGTPATVVLAVDHDDDRRLVWERRGARIGWVPGGSPTGDDNPLIDTVRALPRPEGRVQAWACAEAGTIRQVRSHLLHEWGVERDDVHAAAYWKAGLDATANDDRALAQYRAVLANGADPNDPNLREKIEFELATL